MEERRYPVTWGGLNPALTSWRQGINARFPRRDQATDGARADKHHGKASQHQEDPDGTVDAFDCDVNFLRSGVPGGNRDEKRIAAALKRDFAADSRAYLWIYNREIASRRVGPWATRDYDGDSPHTEHLHFESREIHEDDGSPWKFTHTDALLRALDREDDDMDSAQIKELAAATAEALLTSKVKVGDEQWTVGACIGYQARKAFEQDLNTDGVEALLTRIADGLAAQQPAAPAADPVKATPVKATAAAKPAPPK